MAGSVNKVILIGNLGKDPEVRTMPFGDRVANFSIATSESWKDKATGERKEKTEWHKIAIFNQGIVGVVERYLKKGAKVYIEGQLETRKWIDDKQQERYSTEIVLRPFGGSLTMLSSGGGESALDKQRGEAFQHAGDAARNTTPYQTENMEDEIPF